WDATFAWRAPNPRAQMLLTAISGTDVVAGTNGHVFVLDQVGRRVYVLSASGVLLDSLGRQGHGPAELAQPASITLDDEQNIDVYDRVKGTIVRWSPIGELSREITVDSFVFGPSIVAIDGTFIIRDLIQSPPSMSSYALKRIGTDGRSSIATGP